MKIYRIVPEEREAQTWFRLEDALKPGNIPGEIFAAATHWEKYMEMFWTYLYDTNIPIETRTALMARCLTTPALGADGPEFHAIFNDYFAPDKHYPIEVPIEQGIEEKVAILIPSNSGHLLKPGEYINKMRVITPGVRAFFFQVR